MSDPLFGNKIAAALLASALLLFGLREVGAAVYGGGGHGGHGDEELHLAYPIEWRVEGAGGEVEEGPTFAQLMQDASASAGERGAKICASCHSLEKGGGNGTGPKLWGVMGRDVASVAGFGYSGALQDFGGVWTYERLDKYLENSQSYIPGTAMAQRIGKPAKRADILAYLQTLSDTPFPLPEPEAVQAGE